ncbi:MAG: hypothetical protein AB1432_16355, partial [Bacteroidota bacterium]
MKKSNFLIALLVCFYINTLAQNYIQRADSLNIISQLNARFGNEYKIGDIVNVDSVENVINNSMYEYINDPYGTLDNCLVFTANQVVANPDGLKSNNVVGIYRNSQIIWLSDFINEPGLRYGGKIYAIVDLTNDGKVEILTSWDDGNGFRGGDFLWVHGWDGTTGTLEVELENEESTIFTHDYKIFKFIDFEGDGIWEIVGYLPGYENEFTDQPLVNSWDGTKYVQSQTIKVDSTEMFFPRKNFAAIVHVKVVKSTENSFKYNYSVKNDYGSKQLINEFNVLGKMDTVFNFTSPEGWAVWDVNSEVYWEDENSFRFEKFSMKYKIKPGEILDNFSFETHGLPIIGEASLRGFNYNLYSGSEYYTRVDDYLNNSVFLSTVAAKLPPSPFEPTVFLDTLINYSNRSFSLTWIQTQQTADKYSGYLTAAKTALLQNNSSLARTNLQNILREVDIDSSGAITSEAYALLR